MSTKGRDKTIHEARRAVAQMTGRDRPGPARFLAVAGLGAALGAIAAFLLDPVRGRSRRVQLRDRGAAMLRDLSRGARQRGRAIRSMVEGKVEALQHAGEEGPMPNDASLAKKVESELFRDPDVPKGGINVNVEQGIVVLRGEVGDDSMKEKLEKAARAIPGVWEVENLLHLPGEPAPAHR